MPFPIEKQSEKYTYADYLTWPDDQRWEIIDGVAYAMSPAPTTIHQRIIRKLATRINAHLEGKKCELFWAPFDVRLADSSAVSDNYVETVVQPDIVVICDKNKLDERGCNGAPDLIIEITSPSTGKNDLTVKFELYQRHGVKEYWIVLPAEQTVLVFKLGEDQTYGKPERYAIGKKITVPLLGDLIVDLDDVFAE